MKKFLLAIGLVLILALPAHAQWGRGMVTGRRILSRDGITTADSAVTTVSTDLAGYSHVRIDIDIDQNTTTYPARVNYNIQVSNGILWLSGDSIQITRDTYDTYDLVGGYNGEYNIFLESLSEVTDVTIYLTPYNAAP